MDQDATSGRQACWEVSDAFINKITAYVKEYMSQYDGSHDFNHVKRVLALAENILSSENQSGVKPKIAYERTLVVLGALLHDVGDKKYLQPGQDASTLVRHLLVELGAQADLAARVQDLVLHVSFSGEKDNPQKVDGKIAEIPELAIVQDADRLDAIGAVGVARCFAFTGARGGSLEGAIDHFGDKLVLLASLMKTESGRKMALARTQRLTEFKDWWDSEIAEAM
ncbi:hd domain-containing protein [Phlyctema vagabunda]|uniref:Hd domain-containing protein n=1 Tax=Phlyctema vagabunda TaxID=108571 RepID=A0ABR4P213_9HELO